MLNKATFQNTVIESAMQASVLKNKVIQNNIANADTPGYKKKTVAFEKSLAMAVDKSKTNDSLDFGQLTPAIETVHDSFSYRLDKNNVDIEAEMVDLYENAAKYDVMASNIINNYKRFNTAISNLR